MRMLSPISNRWSWPSRNYSSDLAGDVFEDFEQIFDSFLSAARTNTTAFQSRWDVREDKDHYMVSVDMPGVKKEDIKIETHEGFLTISGERRRESTDGAGESVFGKYERRFALPTSVNVEAIEAHYADGVLSVALPKAEAAKSRKIEIQSGTTGLFGKLLGARRDPAKKELKDVKVS